MMVIKDPIQVFMETGDMKLTTFVKFWRTYRDTYKHMDYILNKYANISIVQVTVLHSLVVNNGVISPSAIAQWLSTERHNITTLVQRMQKSELVRIERDNNNKRRVNILITDKGRAVFEEARPIARDIMRKTFSSITDDQLIQIQEIFNTISENLSKDESQS